MRRKLRCEPVRRVVLTRRKLHLQTTGSPLTEQQDFTEAVLESCTPACAEEPGDSGRHGHITSARVREAAEICHEVSSTMPSLLFPTSGCIFKLIRASHTAPVALTTSCIIFST